MIVFIWVNWLVFLTAFAITSWGTSTLPDWAKRLSIFGLWLLAQIPSLLVYQSWARGRQRELEQVRIELDKNQEKLSKVQKRLNQIEKGLDLTERQHRVLNLRLGGVYVDDVARVCGCSKRNIEYDISFLKEKGLLD